MNLADGSAGECRPAGQDLAEDRAQRKDVGPFVEPIEIAAGLFRRHVGGGAHDRARLRELGVRAGPARLDHGLVADAPGLLVVGDPSLRQHLRQSPDHHLNLAKAADHDIRGLQVAVDDTSVVGVGHRQADLLEDPYKPRLFVLRTRALRQQSRQGATLDQLHGEVRPAIGERAQLVDRNHAGMLQLSGDLSLLDEPADQVWLVTMLLEQNLDGEVAAQVAVASLDDDAHAAAGDLAEQLEPGKTVGWAGHLGRRRADHRPGVRQRLTVAQVHPRDVREGFGQPRQRARCGCRRQRRRGYFRQSAAGQAGPLQAGATQPSGRIGGPLLAAFSAAILIVHRQTSTTRSRVVPVAAYLTVTYQPTGVTSCSERRADALAASSAHWKPV